MKILLSNVLKLNSPQLKIVFSWDNMTHALKLFLAILLSLLLAFPSFAQHSHGKGALQLSLTGDVLQGQWTMPMEALLGFENLPKTAA